MEEKTRIKWVDFIKGLAIISVVFLHIHNGYEYSNTISEKIIIWVTSFHMPIFFVCSGYFFSYKAIQYKKKIKGKLKSLIIPYIIWGLIIGFFLENIRILLRNKPSDIKQTIINIITLKQSYLACWFLITLFLVYIIEYLIIFITKSLKNKEIVVTIFHISMLLLGIITQRLSFNYFKISHVLISAFFFYLGYIYKLKIEKHVNILIGLVGVILGGVLAFVNSRVRYSTLELGNPILFLTSAILTIIGIFAIVNVLYKKYPNSRVQNFIEWIGKNTIIILITHLIYLYLIRFIEKILNMKMHTFPICLSFLIIFIMEIITIKYLPKFIRKTFGK